MIRIHKPATPPEILHIQGEQRCRTHCANFLLHEAEYRDGTRTFPFDSGIYGHPTVKKALIDAQYGKCAFCERKIREEGDVEHFRPKAASCQGEGEPLLRPGYYWLVYDWVNLLLACGPCNQRHKRNYFPLVDPTKRALSHRDRVENESPLFINPATEDPSEHISFRAEIAFPVNGSIRGQRTIEALGLNTRPNLREARMKHLAQLKRLHEVLKLEKELSQSQEGIDLLNQARTKLLLDLQDVSEFSAMSRVAYHDSFDAPLL